ncbi:serine/threonine-protein kinase SBK1-like [Portunus trituberculatus]|uniref:serine/threonine-protein kinase SBK1-like n=1 Tax=Portunus trituberculatus TaxID=210409 RepID=UPI001E1CC7DC|nr:serine/threonine-protein kinase SBK1-like [Portunus trituberculatus]
MSATHCATRARIKAQALPPQCHTAPDTDPAWLCRGASATHTTTTAVPQVRRDDPAGRDANPPACPAAAMMFPEARSVDDEGDEVDECGEGAWLQEVSAAHVERQFFDVRVLASGWYTQVFSARHQRLSEGRRLVLKAVRRGTTTRRDFLREARHHAFLSACPHVLACFPPPFTTASSFVLPLEEAPGGDLAGLVGRGGVGEEAARRVAAQVGAAVSFTHAAGVVHRDVTPANLLAMDAALAQVKLADFAARRVGAMVTRGALPLPWLAPEVVCLHAHDMYAAHPAQDAWQLGLLLVVLLTGALPWAAADPEDPHYTAWEAWARHPATGLPPRFRLFSPRLLCLLRRLLHPEPALRCPAAALQQEAEAGRRWLARDPDPFDPCLQDAPRPAAFLRRAEQRVARVLRRYLRRASPKYKKVTFAKVLEERREVQRFEEHQEEEDHEEEEEEEEEEEDMGGWFLGSECILDYYCAPP